ncbi:hypothetical protein SUGI_0698890 [Cryptomeria japonica]|nr:hypothetical protein SUGI_0698890 [Cryptomeria japonica]
MSEEDVVNVSSAHVFRVPRPLRESNDSSCSPHLVSIGPFHYGKEELKEMEKSKSEAVRRMQKRIQTQRMDPHASIKTIVENNIVLKDKEIREFYGERIPHFNPIELAWIVTRDACFIYELLINFLGKSYPNQYYAQEVTAYSWINDPVFNTNLQNPTLANLMADILLFENQIPLWVLQNILQIQMGVYFAIVGNSNFFIQGEAVPLEASSRNSIQICFESCIESVKAVLGIWCKKKSSRFSSAIAHLREQGKVINVKLPRAVELTRRGVKIYPVTSEDIRKGVLINYTAIPFTRFDEKTSTLYLPEVRLTPESNTVMRNMVAMEVSLKKKYDPRPSTQFSLFMDELIDGEEDVAILRKAEVIHNFLGSNQQVAQHFNSLTKGINPSIGCKVIDDVRRGLHKYTRKKYKILWREFISAYFSKPCLVAGSMAAVLLLLMTVAQVFCLFFTCNP